MAEIPVSEEFDIFDWDGVTQRISAGDNRLLAQDADDSGLYEEVDPDAILVTSGGHYILNVSLSSTYTFEYRIEFMSLPDKLDINGSNYLFIGVINSGGRSAGLFFSKEGISRVGGPGEAGSHKLLAKSSALTALTDVTVRISIDEDTGRADIFVTETSKLATEGHTLRHTYDPPEGSTSFGDALVIDASGAGACRLKTLRLSSSVLAMNKRPIAVVGDDLAVTLGKSVRLGSTRSYDPEGAKLAYAWSLVSGPEGFSLDDEQSFEGTVPDPIFTAKGLGLHVFELVAKDGQVQSLPIRQKVNVLATSTEIGYVPPTADDDEGINMWRLLPSFWSRVAGKEPIETFWSSLIQITGGEMLRLWQAEASRSIARIPRRKIHKWVGYVTDVPATVESSTIRDSAPVTMSSVKDSGQDLMTNRLTTANANSFVAGDLVLISWSGSSKLSKIQSISEEGGTTSVALTDDVIPTYESIDSGIRNGRYVAPTGGEAARFSVSFGDLKIAAIDNLVSDLGETLYLSLSTDDLSLSHGREISSVDIEAKELLLGDPLEEDAYGLTWKVLYYVGGEAVEVRALSYLSCAEDMSEYFIEFGDVLTGSVTYEIAVAGEPVADTVTENVDLTVVGVREKRIGFLAGDQGYTKIDQPEVRRLQKISIHEDIAHVPRLQRSGSKETWYLDSPVDFSVSTGVLSFEHLEGSDGEVKVEAGETVFVSNSLDITDLDEGEEVSIIILPYKDPELGRFPATRKTLSVDDGNGGTTKLDRLVFSGKPATGDDLAWTLIKKKHRDVGTWWAEYTYVDNWADIENNFGLLIGLKKEDMDDPRIDYLSSVRALWYAMWGGPTVSNIQLGAQVFFNQAFTEAKGTITEIEEAYSADEGRITIRDQDDPSQVRTYFYPMKSGLSLAINPTAAPKRPYQEGDLVEAFRPLTKGVEVKDWVNSDGWWSTVLSGQDAVSRIHSFQVVVDLDTVAFTDAFSRLSEYIDRMKPAHTRVFMVGLKNLADSISPIDSLALGQQPAGVIGPGTPITWSAIDIEDSLYVANVDGYSTESLAAAMDHYGDNPILSGEAPYCICPITLDVGGSMISEGEALHIGSQFMGTAKIVSESPAQVVIDLYGGFQPVAGNTVVGQLTTTSFTLDSVTRGEFPLEALVDQGRSEVWIPLKEHTIRGPVEVTGTVSAVGAGTVDLDAPGGVDQYIGYRIYFEDPDDSNALKSPVWITAWNGTQATLHNVSATAAWVGIGTTYRLYPPKGLAWLSDIPPFKEGSVVVGESGHTAKVKYLGPSYIRLYDLSVEPYAAFRQEDGTPDGWVKVQSDDGLGFAEIDNSFVPYVFPDTINTPSHHIEHSPKADLSAMSALWVSIGGLVSTNDTWAEERGLVDEDLEVHKIPDDPNTRPSFAPGWYYVDGQLLKYNYVPDSGPNWVLAGPALDGVWVRRGNPGTEIDPFPLLEGAYEVIP